MESEMRETRGKYIIPMAPPWPETVQLALDALGRAPMPKAEKDSATQLVKAAMAVSINHWRPATTGGKPR